MAAQHYQPDLVLLDISMPLMDGIPALPRIVAGCPKTTVVMLTAHGVSSGLPQKAEALGAAGYILKGTPIVAVLEELRELLAHRAPPPTPGNEPGPEPRTPEPH